MIRLEEECMTLTANEDTPGKYIANSDKCENTALVFCITDINWGPVPGENLPRMPCIPPLLRRKRESSNKEKEETSAVGRSSTSKPQSAGTHGFLQFTTTKPININVKLIK